MASTHSGSYIHPWPVTQYYRDNGSVNIVLLLPEHQKKADMVGSLTDINTSPALININCIYLYFYHAL